MYSLLGYIAGVRVADHSDTLAPDLCHSCPILWYSCPILWHSCPSELYAYSRSFGHTNGSVYTRHYCDRL